MLALYLTNLIGVTLMMLAITAIMIVLAVYHWLTEENICKHAPHQVDSDLPGKETPVSCDTPHRASMPNQKHA
jgi:presenilin-like A22 family membrane protease